jgi:hypothetical protein
MSQKFISTRPRAVPSPRPTPTWAGHHPLTPTPFFYFNKHSGARRTRKAKYNPYKSITEEFSKLPVNLSITTRVKRGHSELYGAGVKMQQQVMKILKE